MCDTCVLIQRVQPIVLTDESAHLFFGSPQVYDTKTGRLRHNATNDRAPIFTVGGQEVGSPARDALLRLEVYAVNHKGASPKFVIANVKVNRPQKQTHGSESKLENIFNVLHACIC